LTTLGRRLTEFFGMGGSRQDVDSVRHLIGLPLEETLYANVDPGLAVGGYSVTVKDVPVDTFWSIAVYEKDGFMEQNGLDAYNITGVENEDGSITVPRGGCTDDCSNCLPITEGWNCAVRMYQPRAEILHETWTFPDVQPMSS
jgi:hypothetical protein